MPTAKNPKGNKPNLSPAQRKAVRSIKKEYTKKLSPRAGQKAAVAARTYLRASSRTGPNAQSKAMHAQMDLNKLARRASRKNK